MKKQQSLVELQVQTHPCFSGGMEQLYITHGPLRKKNYPGLMDY
jgi:hypothetical protein